jgi:hypothetical protein
MVRLTGSALHSRPDINNRSEIMWSESYPPLVSDIYLFSRGIVQKLTDDSYYDVAARINDHGDYAYLIARDYFGNSDIAWHLGGKFTIHDSFNSPNAHPDINNSGQVVWDETFTSDASDQRVFFFNGQQVQQITFNGICNHAPRLNNLGEIVISATNTNLPSGASAILLFAEGVVTPLTSVNKLRAGPINNDHGQIVWSEADLDGLNDKIMLWEDGVASPFVQGNDVVGASIGNNGDITYLAWDEPLRLYEQVLFRASEKVFYHLPDLGLSHGAWAAINDCGELAWLARPLNDGDTVVLVLRRIAPNGDFNHDCRIDAYDFSILENCFTGPDAGPADGLLADCTRADFDDDGDVDETDVSAFLGAAGGPAAPVPDCQAIALCGS